MLKSIVTNYDDNNYTSDEIFKEMYMLIISVTLQ